MAGTFSVPHVASHLPLQLWDVGGGTPVSSPLLSTYLSNCQAVLAMYDCTSNEVGGEGPAVLGDREAAGCYRRHLTGGGMGECC